MSQGLVQVPDVRCLHIQLAKARIIGAGFDVLNVRREPSNCPRDLVTRQYLGVLPRGTALNLVVSEGPAAS